MEKRRVNENLGCSRLQGGSSNSMVEAWQVPVATVAQTYRLLRLATIAILSQLGVRLTRQPTKPRYGLATEAGGVELRLGMVR